VANFESELLEGKDMQGRVMLKLIFQMLVVFPFRYKERSEIEVLYFHINTAQVTVSCFPVQVQGAQ
jgi:hypothetical protein